MLTPSEQRAMQLDNEAFLRLQFVLGEIEIVFAEIAPTLCDECGEPTASDEGICFQCQCELHAVGAFDMDGDGWRF